MSLIYTIYDPFGSGITVPGYGFLPNDRGALFSLDPRSPNVIAPRKRPFHTLLPGFLMKQGKPVMAFGLMGGSQQAQGHAQVLVSMIDLGANRQGASDAARFSHAQATCTLYLESNLFARVGAPLSARGHKVVGGQWGYGRLPSDRAHAGWRTARRLRSPEGWRGSWLVSGLRCSDPCVSRRTRFARSL